MPTSPEMPQASSLPRDLVSVIVHPRRTFPRLLERRRPLEVMAFSAISGIYVAYVTAERIHLGTSVGFVPALVFVVLCGAGLGLLALSFTDVVLTATEEAAGGVADRERIAGVFGYSAWPFLPLILVIGLIEFTAYGPLVFSSDRPQAPGFVPIAVTVLEIATIGTWLILMVEGTASAAKLSELEAARTLGRTFVRMVMILILLAIIAFVSFMI